MDPERTDPSVRKDRHAEYDPSAQPYTASTDPAERPPTPPSVQVLRRLVTQPYPFDEQPGESHDGRPTPVPQPEGLPKPGRDPVDGDSPLA